MSKAQAIALAPVITPTEYEQLKDQRVKTVDERHAQHEHELQRRYSIPSMLELKVKDDEG